MSRLDADTVDQILLLRQQGLSIRQIAAEVGCGKTTVGRLVAGEPAGGASTESEPAESVNESRQIAPDRDMVETQRLRDEVARLRGLVRTDRREQALERYIREEAFGLANCRIQRPSWLLDTERRTGHAGTPTLLLSDWHWGETVDPAQMFGINEYSMAIAADRARLVTERTIRLLRDDISSQDWPGIVVALGGDMISGAIHPELAASDEVPPAAQCADLCAHLIETVETLADEFGRVYVPCVTGNHGRATHKPWGKGRVHTSYDWLAYVFLERHFANDDRVTVEVSAETDVLYRLHNTRYLLTHGDSLGVRGGNGIIGAIGPIMRGVRKLQSTNADIGRPFDVCLMGHWHQLITLKNVIVNGSLKGYCEYARSQRFSYEPARQALWVTHPEYGVTITTHVLAQEPRPRNTQQESVL